MVGNIIRQKGDRMLLENFAEITNSLTEPHFLMTPDGCILAANRAANAKMSAVSCSTELTSLQTLATDAPAKLNQMLQMWSRSRAPLPGSLTVKTDGGTLIQCLCKGNTIRPAQNGEAALIMMKCTDKRQSSAVFITLNEKIEQLKREIAERRNAELEVRLLNQELEQRVEDRTLELQQSNVELSQSLEELKNTQNHLVRTERLAALGGMVAGVAHEVNTPVGVCVTAASYFDEQVNHYSTRYGEGALTRSDFESFLNIAAESSAIILANLGRAADLVRSFKQLAVDQTSDECRHINMKNYIEELLISLRPYVRNTSHRISLNSADDIEIESYPGAIAQIINNLIGNSMIHGFEGRAEGLINIDVTRELDHVLLHYTDNGVGIAKQNQAQIFDPFFTTKRNQGGSGLGMNVVYNLVTGKLGGEISFTSEEQQGTHFYISLPIAGRA